MTLRRGPGPATAGALAASAVAALGLAIAIHFLLSATVWVSETLHSTVEALGAFSALVLAMLILIMPRQQGVNGRAIWISSGLIGMGILDGFHSAMIPGAAFVGLHSISTLVGGLLFAGAWLSVLGYSPRSYRTLPSLAAVVACIIGILSIVYWWALPAMTLQNYFSPTAIAINGSGGILFLVAAGGLLTNRRTVANSDPVLFATLCLLFGIAGLSFPFSQPWEPDWWFWHFLRLAAYGIALWYVFILYQRTVRQALVSETERKRAEEELRRSHDQLEVRVIERTAEIAARARMAALGADTGIALTQSEALQQCAEAMVGNPDAAFAHFWVLNEDGTTLELHASAGLYTHTDDPAWPRGYWPDHDRPDRSGAPASAHQPGHQALRLFGPGVGQARGDCCLCRLPPDRGGKARRGHGDVRPPPANGAYCQSTGISGR